MKSADVGAGEPMTPTDKLDEVMLPLMGTGLLEDTGNPPTVRVAEPDMPIALIGYPWE
jgi:hypothetical protein